MKLPNWIRRFFALFRPRPKKTVARVPSPVDLEAALDYIHAHRHKEDTFIVFGGPTAALVEFVERVNGVLGDGRAELYNTAGGPQVRMRHFSRLISNEADLRVLCMPVGYSTGWRIDSDSTHVLVLNRVSDALLQQMRARVRGSGILYAPANNQVLSLWPVLKVVS